jgi:hypothetical protein
MNKSIIRQVMDLEGKSLIEMKQLYNDIMPSPLKTHASRDHLRPRLAYRLQELAFGGLSENAKSKLLKIAEGDNPKKFANHSNLLAGTKICKEWNGTQYEVEVLKDGFEHKGRKFKSLSAIAKVITGTKWNGLKFFKVKYD